MHEATFDLLQQYFRAYNARDIEGLLALVHDRVVHDREAGQRQVGKQALARFLTLKHALYDEHVYALTLLISPDGERAAAEYQVLGFARDRQRFAMDSEATYRVCAGTFFDIQDGLISRISSHGLRRKLWGQAA